MMVRIRRQHPSYLRDAAVISDIGSKICVYLSEYTYIEVYYESEILGELF